MGNHKLFFYAILTILLAASANIAAAATLHGKIYDLELNELNDVVVTVDSEPIQRYVSKDGGYSFELNPGTYSLSANYAAEDLQEYSSTDEVTIDKDGDYVYDLFLFPDFEEENDIIDEEVVELPDTAEQTEGSGTAVLISVVAALVVLLIVAYFFVGRIKKKKQEEESQEAAHLAEEDRRPEISATIKKALTSHKNESALDEDLNQVIGVIRNEGGRTTQKEIRKHIPLSEAKISLMISELEHKGIIEKVKKGRGNILILKKR